MTFHAIAQFIVWGCWALFLGFWIVTSFFTKRTIQHERRYRVPTALLIVLWFVAITNSSVRAFVRHSLWNFSSAFGAIAIAGALVSITVLLWARITLGGNWSGHVALKEGHTLTTTGPYAYIRHPIYAGVLLLSIANALILANPLGLLIVAICCMVFIPRMSKEERLMQEQFSGEYPAYKARTKRLIPGIY